MQKNEIISPVSFTLVPESLGTQTLNEILADQDTEIIKKGNKLCIRRCTNDMTATLEIETYNTGRETITQSIVPHRDKKTDYLSDIKQMKESGMKQKDIAFILQISESRVSQLVKKLKQQ